VAVVTGGTGGLGGAVVAAFLARGVRVAVPYRDERGAARLREAHGDGVLLARVDLTAEDEVGAFAGHVGSELGRVDALAALTGGYREGGIEELTPAGWREVLDLNLMTAALATRAFLPALRASRGAIVYAGSRIAERPFAGAAGAIVAKAAVRSLAQVVAIEAGPHGVRVNVIVPSVIDTAANRAASPDADTSSWVPPEQIADTVVWLCSPAAAAVSGAAVPVSGVP
jgi:NAD(P)-dependent dehydrogenase (short-subunit alcohol dehydrogenase family)